MAFIYRITNVQNGKIYVGQTRKDVESRFEAHKKFLRLGQHNNPHLQRAWDKYGPEAFQVETLLECPEEELDSQEDHFIEVFGSWDRKIGYNLMRRASGKGRVSDETRKKISDRAKGRKNHCQPHSEEAKRKMSEIRKGKPLSEETKSRMSRPRPHTRGIVVINDGVSTKRIREEEVSEFVSLGWKVGGLPTTLGFKFSAETKEKMSLVRRGMNQGTIWIHRDKEKKRISRDELDQYASEGWTIGLGPKKVEQ